MSVRRPLGPQVYDAGGKTLRESYGPTADGAHPFGLLPIQAWSAALTDAYRAATRPTAYVLAISAALGLGLAVRLWLAWMPMSWQITHLLPDDAFYYFQTARNIAHGRGVTLDGSTPTNGFHPLWMAILVPIYTVANGDVAVHVSLTVSALFDTAAATLVLPTARLVTQRRTLHVLAVAFYALNPGAIQSSVNGMETAVSLFTTLLVVFLFVRLLTSQQELRRGWLSFGLAGGAAILARTDNAVILLVLLLAVPMLAQHRAGGWLFSIRSALTALAVAAPWFIWSSWSIGTPLQVSAEAAPYVAHANFTTDTGSGFLSPEIRHSLHFLADVVTRTLPELYFTSESAVLLLVVTVCAIALVAGAAARDLLRSLRPLIPWGVGLALLISVHSLIRWHVREWYFPATIPLAALSLIAVLDVAIGCRPRATWRSLSVSIGCALVLPVVLVWSFASSGLDHWANHPWYPQQRVMHETARALSTTLPPGARVAGFNAGILSYYVERPTVNLDGVMDPQAFAALKQRGLAAYLKDRRIDYVVDFDGYVFGEFGTYWGTNLATLLTPLTMREAAPATAALGSYRAFAVGGGRLTVGSGTEAR